MASEIFKFESVDDDGRWRMDDGPLVYYKLTLWAKNQAILLKPLQVTTKWVWIQKHKT